MSWNERSLCEWVRERIDSYCDDAESDLRDEERLRVERHMESCASCARELALVRGMRAGLRALSVPVAPAGVIERAAQEVASPRGNVVRLRAPARMLQWVAVAAALVVLAAAVWIDRERAQEDAAAQSQAVEQAAHEAAIAFAYVKKYARRTGDIVQDQVIERRILEPVEKAMEKSGVAETKPNPDQS